MSVNLLRKRRLRPVRDEAGLSQAVLEEVAVQALGLGLGLGLDSRRWLFRCSG